MSDDDLVESVTSAMAVFRHIRLLPEEEAWTLFMEVVQELVEQALQWKDVQDASAG